MMALSNNALLCLLLWFSGAVLVLAADVDSIVKSTKGDVQFAPLGSTTFQTLKAGDRLSKGSQLKTGPSSEAVITVTPGSAVRLDEKTTMSLLDMEFAQQGGKVSQRKALIDLTDGTVSALIDHNDPQVTDFKIKTPQGTCAARGTFYGVSVGNGKMFVNVAEGKVGLQKPKKSSPSNLPSPPEPAAPDTKKG